jgi:hypothetical protein
MRYFVSVVTSLPSENSSTNGLARKYIWEGKDALVLDHLNSPSPSAKTSRQNYGDWKLVRRNGAIWIKAGNFEREINPTENGVKFDIPGIQNPIRIEVRTAQSPTPAFLPANTSTVHVLKPDQSEYRIFYGAGHGTGGHCSGTLKFKKRYVGLAGRTKAFVLKKNRKGYLLKSRVADLTLTRISCAYSTLKRKDSLQLTECDLADLKVTWGLNWWRINSVAVNPLLEAVEDLGASEAELDLEWFKDFAKKLAIGCAALSLVIAILPKSKDKAPDDLPPSTLVQLKKPKVIEKIVKSQSIPAPPKLESKPESKPEARPENRKEAKHESKHHKEPPKVDLAALARARAEAEAKAQAIAQANQKKADLAKSLNFLATAPQSKTVVVHDQSDTRFKTLAQAVPTDVSSDALRKLAKHTSSDGPIETSSARAMNTPVHVSGAKTMNEVQGRVAIASLADPSTSGIESELTSKGISVGGDGSLSQSEVEKVLSKHLQRFQYCYEKALLSDASLAGHILAQWTIGEGGSVSNISIVRSQLNNTGLHQCLMSEISKVKFPAPQGGTVVVKYPFAFSSTPM